MSSKLQLTPKKNNALKERQEAITATANAKINAGIEYLVSERRRLGITQKELAKRTGMSQPQIAKIENMNSIPGWQVLNRYAVGIGVDIELSFQLTPATKMVAH